jgi:SAM-dependent methyltransferase
MYTEYRSRDENSPEGWADKLDAGLRATSRFLVDRRYALIRRHLQAPVLDAGCGRGQWVRFLNGRGIRTIGLDYSERMIAANRAEAPEITWLQGDIKAMPLADGAVNAVISWGVIEHDEAGPGAALAEFRRVLAPGGRILVTVPVDSPAQRRASKADFSEGSLFFQYFFTTEELAQAVADSGFEVLDCGMASPAHPNLIWPGRHTRAGRFAGRFMQVAGLVYPSAVYGNMIYCLAQR